MRSAKRELSTGKRPEAEWVETDVRSKGVMLEGVRGGSADRRAWVMAFPEVSALAAWGVSHAGVITAPAPFEIVRTKLSGAYFIGGLSGEGRVYLNGGWVTCRAGQAVLLLPGVLNAFHTLSRKTWCYCWMRFSSGPSAVPASADRTQVLTEWNAEPLSHALLGLRAEARGGRDPSRLQRWSEQVCDYMRLFRRHREPDPRVVRLWDAVEKNLAAEWSLDQMIRVASVSAEHLRRLCHAACGRGPHAHLMHLRMKRAAHLLLNTNRTIERIADAVGCGNAFAFSTAFKRVIGWPPSTYARRSLPQ